MAEQPAREIGKHAIRQQSDDGASIPAYLADEIPYSDDEVEDLSLLATEIKRYPDLYNLFDKFINLLKRLDYHPDNNKIVSANTDLAYKYTHVNGICEVEGKQQDQYRALIYIREEILKNPSRVDESAINMIISAFEKDTTIIIFSGLEDFPHFKIYRLLKEQWPKWIKKAEFVPPKYIEYLTKQYDQIEPIQNQNIPLYGAKKDALKKEVASILDGMLGKI
jgi:hypothetical protein